LTGFLGRYEFQLDEKGRVSLPASYRRQAEGARFVIVQWEVTHLTLFPDNVWGGVMERLLELRRDRPEMANLLRDVTSRADHVEPDRQGRILIPGWLKDRARLEGTVLLVGAMDRIELWNPTTFQERHPDDLMADPEKAALMHRIFG